MDLISTLAEQLSVNQMQAKGLAGGLLGLVKAGVEQQVGNEAAQSLEASVPEMVTWQQEGDTPDGQPGIAQLLGGMDLSQLGNLGDIGSALGGLLGNAGEVAGMAGALTDMVQKFDLDADKAKTAFASVTQFLEERLPGDLIQQMGPIMALLKGQEGKGLAGMIGGFFS